MDLVPRYDLPALEFALGPEFGLYVRQRASGHLGTGAQKHEACTLF